MSALPVEAPLTPINTNPRTITAIEAAKNIFFFPRKLTVFFSLLVPKNFTSLKPTAKNERRISRVTTSAVNIERIIPSASVYANPFTVPEPLIPNTKAAIKVVTLPSTIAESAF